MRLITDWHIHSKYSRACSRDLELPKIAAMCQRKGIHVAATGDWTHPKWVEHLKENLVETAPGMYGLKDGSSSVQFMLVTEISQIYKRGDKTRRVHNLVFAPSLEIVDRVNAEFDRRNFNRKSDGRPILGIDSEVLYKVLKEIDERIIVVPAHAWTPWYSVFGSKSGFDSLDECFGEMTKYIYAIETGLSSNPKMNWQLSQLENIAFISNSDAHSPDKLGREANVFDLEAPTYDSFVAALRDRDPKRFVSTIEFFPEEGKYHWDGCANCGFSCAPQESKRLGLCCPKCRKPLILGVEHRVEALMDRDATKVALNKVSYVSIVPLKEVIGEVFQVGVSSKKVCALYDRLTEQVASEFTLLLETPIEQISVEGGVVLAEAIRRVRAGLVHATPGYDGIFGTIKVFNQNDRPGSAKQSPLL